MMDRKRLQGHLLALFSVLMWSTTFISTKILQESFSSIEILFIRFAFGYLILFLLRPRMLAFEGWRREGLYMLAAASGIFLYYYMENVALEHTMAGNVSVLVSTAPFFIALVYKLFRPRETKLGLFFTLGFVVTFIGLVLIAFPAGSGFSLNPMGDGIALAASIIWGFYSYFVDRIALFGHDVIMTTRRTFFYGLIFMIPVLMVEGFSVSLEEMCDPVNLMNLFFLGLGASALCFVAWAGAIGRIGAVVSGQYIYIIPAFTLVFSFLILGERITLQSALGAILVMAGLFVSNIRREGYAKISQS